MNVVSQAIRTIAPEPATVSVILPVYNGAAFLRPAIESVLGQTLPVDEILVIDDGSTDDSAEIARSYPGVRVLSFENGGLSTARNRGMAAVTSTWIALIDADDVWVPDKMERQMAMLAQHPEADVCVSGFQILQDGKLGEAMRAPENFGPTLEHRLGTLPSCMVIRHSALVAIGGFDPVMTHCEDWDCLLRLKRAGYGFACCPEPLMHYRRHGNNLTADPGFNYIGELQIYDHHLAPNVPRPLRAITRWIHVSRLEGDVAIMERELSMPHLGRMMRSLAMWPLGSWKRHKIATHMVLTRLGLIGKR